MPSRLDKLFDRIYTEHGPTLLGMCRRIVHPTSAVDPEDVFQEVCVAIFRALPWLASSTNLTNYLARIAVNRCVSALREHTRFLHHLNEFRQIFPSLLEGSDEKKARVLRVLHRLILTMPLKYSEVLNLRLANIPYKEIATVLGISVWAAQKRNERAIQWLRERLPPDDLQYGT